jgi:hypothetical protein
MHVKKSNITRATSLYFYNILLLIKSIYITDNVNPLCMKNHIPNYNFHFPKKKKVYNSLLVQ